jgi:hypothetical protein
LLTDRSSLWRDFLPVDHEAGGTIAGVVWVLSAFTETTG